MSGCAENAESESGPPIDNLAVALSGAAQPTSQGPPSQSGALPEDPETVLAACSALTMSSNPIHGLLSGLNIGVLIADRHDLVSYVNDHLAALLGTEPVALFGLPLTEAFPLSPESCQALSCLTADDVQDQRDAPFIARVARPDRQTRCLQFCPRLLFDAEGTYLGCLTTVTDVTDHFQMLTALRENHELFRAHYDESPLAYQSLDHNGNILEVNPAWTELLGYEPEEVISRSFGEFITSEYAEIFPTRFQKFLQTGRVHEVDFEMICKDGSTRLVSISGRIGNDRHGNFSRTHCIITDMTSRLQAERQLRESEARYRAVVEDQAELICRLDPTEVVTFVNDVMCETVQRSHADLIGKPLESASNERCISHVREIIRRLANEDVVVSESQMTLPSGELRWHQWNGRAIRDDHGKVCEYQFVGSDITNRKLAEIELQRRERHMSGLAEGLQSLLSSSENMDFSSFLAAIGSASRASRAYYFRKHPDEQGRTLVSQIAEWCAIGIEPQIDNPILQNMPVPPRFEQWERELSAGNVLNGATCDFNEAEQAFLASQDVKSVLIIPLMVDGEAVGIIGFDDCISAQRWEPIEVSFLTAAAGGLAQALKRWHVEQELRKREQDFEDLAASRQRLLHESDHRTKNILASLDALIDLVRYRADSPEQFAELLQGRIKVMAAVHRMLAGAEWHSASFTALADTVIKQFEDNGVAGQRITIDGESLSVVPRQATALAMILHELLVNSQRHGVLRPEAQGRVHISWNVLERWDTSATVQFVYREDGSTQVVPSESGVKVDGIGLQLIEGFSRFELNGSYEGRFVPGKGFTCTIKALLEVN